MDDISTDETIPKLKIQFRHFYEARANKLISVYDQGFRVYYTYPILSVLMKMAFAASAFPNRVARSR